MPQKISCMLGMLFLAPVLIASGTANTEKPFSVSLVVRAHGVTVTQDDLNAVLGAAKQLLAGDGVNISFLVAPNQFDSNHNVIDDGKVLGCTGIKSLLKQSIETGPNVHVHIVKDIPCCEGAMQVTEGDTIVGCSGSRKPIIVRAADNPSLVPLTAIQWMHELGHNRGLQHSMCQDSIMFRVPGFVSTNLGSCERLVFSGGLLSNPVCRTTSAQNCTGIHPQIRPALR